MRSIFRFAAILSLVAESQHTWADEPDVRTPTLVAGKF